eukprot:Hpha_TRINITY_DN15659_c3_g5::TRINITY_DN15659_c3_g5_i1::g.101354::m.101354
MNPTTTPTASPTAHPTTAPTGIPTSAPTASPTYGPLLPTTPPTLAPSLPPSTSPSITALTFPPSTPPTISPTAPPSEAPTGHPSPLPSISPSLNPSEGPTGHPTSSPSVVPPPPPVVNAKEVNTATAAVGETTTALATANLGAAGAAQGTRLAMAVSDCRKFLNEDVPKSIHMTQLSIPALSENHPMHAGCVVANLGIWVGIGILHKLFTFVVFAMLKKFPKLNPHGGEPKYMDAEGLVVYPSGTIAMGVLLSQGTTMTGARLLRTGESFLSVLTGLVGMIFGVCIAGIITEKGIHAERDGAIFKRDREVKGCVRDYVVGTGEWLSLERQHSDRWGVCFKTALPGLAWVLAVDVWGTVLLAVLYGMAGQSCMSCAMLRISDVVVCVVVLGSIFYLGNPYVHPLRKYGTVIAQVCVGIGAFIFAMGYFDSNVCSDDKGPDHPGFDEELQTPGAGIASLLIAVGGGVLAVTILADGAINLWNFKVGRRKRLRAMLQRFKELDEDGSGELSVQEVYAGLERVYGLKLSLAEVEEIFNQLDTDQGGSLDIREFINGEERFWGIEPVGSDDEADVLLNPDPTQKSPNLENSTYHPFVDSVRFADPKNPKRKPYHLGRSKRGQAKLSQSQRIGSTAGLGVRQGSTRPGDSPRSRILRRAPSGGGMKSIPAVGSVASEIDRRRIKGSRLFDSVMPGRQSSSPGSPFSPKLPARTPAKSFAVLTDSPGQGFAAVTPAAGRRARANAITQRDSPVEFDALRRVVSVIDSDFHDHDPPDPVRPRAKTRVKQVIKSLSSTVGLSPSTRPTKSSSRSTVLTSGLNNSIGMNQSSESTSGLSDGNPLAASVVSPVVAAKGRSHTVASSVPKALRLNPNSSSNALSVPGSPQASPTSRPLETRHGGRSTGRGLRFVPERVSPDESEGI